MGGKTANKANYFDKLKSLLEGHKSIFIVTVDNVSSQQMHKIRRSLRGDGEVKGVVLMGKNTMVRNIIAISANVVLVELIRYKRSVVLSKGSLPTFPSMSVSYLTSRATLASFSRTTI